MMLTLDTIDLFLDRLLQPRLPRSYEKKLRELVVELGPLQADKCRTALDYALRALEYDPRNKVAIEQARLMAWTGLKPFHLDTCKDPIRQEQLDDPRLDAFFNECSVPDCSYQWIPSHPQKIYGYSPGALVARASSTGFPGYCTKCKRGFCPEHVKYPVPEHRYVPDAHCPVCGARLNMDDTFGRKSKQAPRLAKRLAHVIVVREGYIPPDKDYCTRVFHSVSTDVLEDVPGVTALSLYPWEDRSNLVLEYVQAWLKTHKRDLYASAHSQVLIWPAKDTRTDARLYIVKFWSRTPRVTLDNIFGKTTYSEDFSFEAGTLDEQFTPASNLATDLLTFLIGAASWSASVMLIWLVGSASRMGTAVAMLPLLLCAVLGLQGWGWNFRYRTSLVRCLVRVLVFLLIAATGIGMLLIAHWTGKEISRWLGGKARRP